MPSARQGFALFAEHHKVDPCRICSSAKGQVRDLCGAIPQNVVAMERIREFHGQYHVLNGLISLWRIGPDDINIKRC